ncbi:MAG: YdbH domain-containing protein [Alphaproteobacteria bacterium]|nr:YdbH domain-containing protein [Alphaproteobacteria bacterium]
MILALPVLVLGGLWHWRLALAEHALREFARANDVAVGAVSVEDLGFDGAEISGLRIGPGGVQQISHVRVDWSPSGLLGGRVGAIAVEGAQLKLGLDGEGRLSVEGLPPLARESSAGDGFRFPGPLPFSRLSVRDSELAIALPDGTARLSVDGSVDVSADSLRAEFVTGYSADTVHGEGTGGGTVNLSWTRQEAPRAAFDLRFDRLLAAGVSATDLRIAGTSGDSRGGVADLTIRAEVAATMVEAGGYGARDVTVTVSLSDGRADIAARGEALDMPVEITLQAHPFDPSRPATFTAQARGGASGVAALLPGVNAAGDVSVSLEGTVVNLRALYEARDAIAEAPLRVREYGSARLDVETDLQTFALDGVLDANAVAVSATARWNGDHADLDIGLPSRIDGVVAAPRFTEILSRWLPNPAPFDLAFAEGMGSAPTLRVDVLDTGTRVRAIGGLRVRLPDGSAALGVESTLDLDRDGQPELRSIAAMEATLTDVRTVHGVASGTVLVTELVRDGPGFAGTVSGDVALDAARAPAMAARRAELTIDGEVKVSADAIALATVGPTGLRVHDASLPGGLTLPGRNALSLVPGENRLAFDRVAGVLSLDLRAAAGGTRLAWPQHGIATRLDAVSVSGAWPGRVQAAVTGLDADLGEGRALRAGRLDLGVAGDTARQTVSLKAVDSDIVLPRFALPPVDIGAKLVRRDVALEGEVELVADGGQPRLRARANHNLVTGRGQAEVVDAELRFAPGVLQPVDLRPGLEPVLEDVFATLTLGGTLEWRGDGGLQPDLLLDVSDVAAAAESMEFRDASLRMRLTGFPDIRTPPGQSFRGRVRVGRLAPMPVEGAFQLRTDPAGELPQLVVEDIRVGLLPGTLSTGRFVIAPPETDTEITVRLEGADLGNAFDVLDVEGLGGSGTISGTVPLVVRGERVGIEGGRLAGDGPGTLFFDLDAIPAELSERGDAVSLVLRALSNFDYREMSLDLDKSLDGPGTMRVRLLGENPEVLDGHPFDFNIALETDFDRLAALVLDGLNTSQGLLRALARPGSGVF